MPSVPQSQVFTTRHEINFLVELRQKNPGTFEKYASLIVRDIRSYDATVNVAEVKRAIARLQETAKLPDPRFHKVAFAIVVPALGDTPKEETTA